MDMKKMINDRWEVIEPLIRGKRVVDIGCVNHEASSASSPEWLHGKICATAKSVLGVDYAESEVEELRRNGFDVIHGNAESLALNEKFEVVIAGNLIEHLSNPGLFLDGCYRHLAPGGTFILTTDNCYGLRSLRGIFCHDRVVPNREHVLAFEEAVFRQLLSRHHFRVVDFYYYNGPYSSKWKKRWIDGLCHIRKSWAWQMLAIAAAE